MRGGNNMKINDDRTLYDLCRRYKYHYNACKSLKEVDSKYWNKHLRRAYKDAQNQLDDTTKRIIMLVLSEFIDPYTSVSIDVDVPYDYLEYPRFGKMVRPKGTTTVSITDERFAEYVKKLLELWHKP